MNDSTATMTATLPDLSAHGDYLRRTRRHLHQHPELAYDEHHTAAFVAQELRSWGYEVVEGVGRTGVVASLTAGTGQKTIAIRADMDALPIGETTGLPYASVNAGKMHACGHDGHTTMALGAARYLAETRRFSGTVRFYFQPAEEIGYDSGARAMIRDGLFERFPCDAVYGVHNHPGEEPGRFLFRSGTFMSANDIVSVRIVGKGGHAARPHNTVDPVVVAASIVMALQTIVSRNVDPLQPAVLTVGCLHGGTVPNVIPGTTLLDINIRSFDAKVRDLLIQRIRDLVRLQAESYGATAEIEHKPGYPCVVNTDAETQFAIAVARELVGDAAVVPHADLIPGSEDFAFMQQERPGCFLRIGNGTGSAGCAVHNSNYDFNDHNLEVGSAYWALLVERYLV